jgi:hypothetical protein
MILTELSSLAHVWCTVASEWHQVPQRSSLAKISLFNGRVSGKMLLTFYVDDDDRF